MTEPRTLPSRTLSRGQLTAALILVTLVPFGLVVVLYMTQPDLRDPTLAAGVEVGPRAWPSENAADARMVPCVALTNPTEDSWRNVNLSVNDQFHFYHPEIVGPQEEVLIPLKFFHTKGNQYYPPESQKLKSITVYAQIPSGARAILKIEDESLDAVLRPQT